MSKRGALILSAILTAFILVLAGGVMTRVVSASAPPAEPTPPPLPTQEARPSSASEREPVRPAPSPGAALTPEQALAIASSFLPGATAAGTPELVSLEGTLAYEVRLDRGPVYLDASNGRLLQDGTRRTASPGKRWEDDDDDEEEHEHPEHSRHREHREHASERREHEDV
jgi:peptidase YpeB-like protein